MPRAIPSALAEPERRALIAEAQKDRSYAICGYISFAREPGSPIPYLICKNRAGKGTAHLGQGRCRHHGGSGRPVTSGVGIKWKGDRTLLTLLQRAKNCQIKQVRDHLDTVKLATVLVDDLANKTSLNPFDREELRRSIETLLKAQSLQLKQQDENTFTFGQVVTLIDQILEIIDKKIGDVELKRQLLNEIGAKLKKLKFE